MQHRLKQAYTPVSPHPSHAKITTKSRVDTNKITIGSYHPSTSLIFLPSQPMVAYA